MFTPKLPTNPLSQNQTTIKTPCSQKRKRQVGPDCPAEPQIHSMKTRVLDTPVRKDAENLAKYDLQIKTRIKLKFCIGEESLDDANSDDPPWPPEPSLPPDSCHPEANNSQPKNIAKTPKTKTPAVSSSDQSPLDSKYLAQ